MKCTTAYLDENGEPSRVYYEALKKYNGNKQKAEREYLEYMAEKLGNFGARHQISPNKKFSPDKFEQLSKKIKLSSDGKSYIYQGKKLKRATSLTKPNATLGSHKNSGIYSSILGINIAPDNSVEEDDDINTIARKSAINAVINKHFNRETDTEDDYNYYYRQAIKDNDSNELAKERRIIEQRIKDRLVAQQQFGNFIHKTLEITLRRIDKVRLQAFEAIVQYNREHPNDPIKTWHDIKKLPEKLQKQLDIKLIGDVFKNYDEFYSIMSKTAKQYQVESLDLNLDLIINDLRFYILEGVIHHIKDTELRMKLPPLSLKIYAEQPLASMNFDFAGTADLILQIRDFMGNFTNKLITLDYKTKTSNKEDDPMEGQLTSSDKTFDRVYGEKLNDIFDTMPNSALNRAKAQQELYAALLKEHGFEVIESRILKFVSSFNRNKEKKGKLGTNLYKVSKLKFHSMFTGYLYKHKPTYAVWHKLRQSVEPTPIREETTGFTAFLEKASLGQATTFIENKERFIETMINHLFKDADGNYFYIDKNPNSTSYNKKVTINFDITTEEGKKKLHDIFAQQFRYVNDHYHNMPGLIVSYFNEMKVLKKKKFFSKVLRNPYDIQVANSILHGLEPEDWDLYVAKDLFPEEAKDLGNDLLVAVNTLTHEAFIIDITAQYEYALKFGEAEDGTLKKDRARTTIAGKYKTNTEVEFTPEKRYSYTVRSKNTNYHMLSLKAAVLALRVRKSDPTFNVVGIKVAGMRINKRKQNIDIYLTQIGVEVEKLRMLSEMAGDEFPPDVKELLDDPKVSKINYDIDTTLKEIRNYLAMPDERDSRRILRFGSRDEYQNLRKEFVDMLDRYFENGYMPYRDLARMAEFFEMTINSPYTSKNEKELMTKALMRLMDFSLNVDSWYSKSDISRFIDSAATSGIEHMQRLQTMYMGANGRIVAQFKKLMKKHDELLKELLDEQGMSEWNPQLIQKVFAPMYQDELERTKIDPEKAMMLKVPGTPEFEKLSKAQKAYIKFFNETIKDALLSLSPPNIKRQIENGTINIDGLVPIIPKHKIHMDKGLKSFGESLLKAIDMRSRRAYIDPTRDDIYAFTSIYSGEVEDNGTQFSEKRRTLLGIDGQGRKDPRDIETNLVTILVDITLEQMKKEQYAIVNTAAKAVEQLVDRAKDLNPAYNSQLMKDVIHQWTSMVIHDRYKEEKLAAVLDTMKNISNFVLFAFSIKQAAIEFSTAQVQGLNAMLTQKLTSMLNADKFFSPEDYLWAMQVYLPLAAYEKGYKYKEMAQDNGLYRADPNMLKHPEVTKHDKYRALQSNIAHGMNRYSIDNSLNVVFLARAHRDGVDKAYIKDGDHWVYDEGRDRRYHIYWGKEEQEKYPGVKYVYGQKVEPGKEIGTKPTTPEEKAKHAAWLDKRIELSKEGQLSKDGRMLLPYSQRERMNIKSYTTRVFGTMDKDGIIFMDFLGIVRGMGSYKKWIFPKLKAYISGEYDDYTMIVKHYDEKTGEMVEEVEQFEGTLTTVFKLVNALRSQQLKLAVHGLSRQQKENLSKLFNDLLMLFLAAFFFSSLVLWLKGKNEDNKLTPLETTLLKGFLNAYTEFNLLGTFMQMERSALPSVSVMIQLGQKLIGLMGAAVGGNVGNIEYHVYKVAHSMAFIRTLEAITGFEGVEKPKKKEVSNAKKRLQQSPSISAQAIMEQLYLVPPEYGKGM